MRPPLRRQCLWAVILVLLFSPFSGQCAGLDGCEEQVRYGAPSLDHDLLCRQGYALSHDPKNKVADWVAFHLTREHLNAKVTDRTDDFQPDPDLPPGSRSELSDYAGSGYDRGHLAPAADMAWSEQAMRESFYLSNMAPQVGIGFNRGIWKKLEDLVRDWAKDRGELYVVEGPIYAKGQPRKTIGEDKVAVPSHFYQVVFDPASVDAIAFILPNAKLKSAALPRYIVSVDEVEKDTGLDFLREIEDGVEKQVEAKVQPGLW